MSLYSLELMNLKKNIQKYCSSFISSKHRLKSSITDHDANISSSIEITLMFHSFQGQESDALYTVFETVQVSIATPSGAFSIKHLVHRKTVYPAVQVHLVTRTERMYLFCCKRNH